jgi:hypothetical protein
MKYTETKKLFFGQYIYRYKVKSPLAFYFYKGKNFNATVAALEVAIFELEEQLKKNKKPTATIRRWNRTYEVNAAHIHQIKQIKDILVENEGEFRSRTEFTNLSIYTNNDALIDNLEKISADESAEVSRPSTLAKDVLFGNKEIYVVNKPSSYEYRLTVIGRINNSTKVAQWLEENSDKVKASNTAIKGFKKEYWLSNLLFYVRDDKVLMIAQMMFGESIKKIEKIVYVGDMLVEQENA